MHIIPRENSLALVTAGPKVRRSLPLGQRTWEGIFSFFPPFSISQSFQGIKPQHHGQWASHKSLPLWVPLLTPGPDPGRRCECGPSAQQECIYVHALPKSVFISHFMENAGVIPLEFPSASTQSPFTASSSREHFRLHKPHFQRRSHCAPQTRLEIT